MRMSENYIDANGKSVLHAGRPQGCAPTMPRSGLPGSSIVGAHPCGRPIGINLRNYPSPSVGARVDDVEKGGPSWSPVGMGCAARSSRSQQGRGPRSHPRRVTMKVTPTDHPASCLSSWLRLMPITAD